MINFKLLDNITQFNDTVGNCYFHMMHLEVTVNIMVHIFYLVFLAFHVINSIKKNSISTFCQIQSNTGFINYTFFTVVTDNFFVVPLAIRFDDFLFSFAFDSVTTPMIIIKLIFTFICILWTLKRRDWPLLDKMSFGV